MSDYNNAGLGRPDLMDGGWRNWKRTTIDELFEQARMNPANPMNEAGRLLGRHCVARKLRAQAKRKRGRVKANKRHRAGRAIFNP